MRNSDLLHSQSRLTIALTCCLCLTPLSLEANRIHTIETPFFIIAGKDYRSVKYTAHLAELLGEWGRARLPQPKRFPDPIVVRLQHSGSPSLDRPLFSVFLEKTGRVSVTFTGDARVSPEALCEALSQAFLKRLAMGHYNRQRAERVPYWLELALACELQSHLYPAIRDHWFRQANDRPLLRAQIVLTARSDFENKAVLQLNAYWFLRALNMEIHPRSNLKRLLKAFLAGEDPLAVMSYALKDTFEDTEAFEVWWSRQIKVTLQKNQPPCLSSEGSRKQILNWTMLVLETDKDSIALWKRRERPSEALDRLIQEIKLKLVRTNPLYFNAALSLGQFLESLYQSPTQSDKILEQFKRDFEKAQLMERKIKGLLLEGRTGS